MKGRETVQDLVAKGDRLTRKILLRLAEGERVKCVTCSHVAPAAELQVGHFIGRSRLSTRFDEKNVSLQCVQCNYFGSGKPVEYEALLRRTWGDETVDDLIQRSKRSLDAGELEEIIQDLEKRWQGLTKRK